MLSTNTQDVVSSTNIIDLHRSNAPLKVQDLFDQASNEDHREEHYVEDHTDDEEVEDHKADLSFKDGHHYHSEVYDDVGHDEIIHDRDLYEVHFNEEYDEDHHDEVHDSHEERCAQSVVFPLSYLQMELYLMHEGCIHAQ